MLILIAGGLLAALGLGSAVVLVGGPLGLVAATPGLLPWVLFPLFTLVGYLLLVVGSDDAAARVPTRVLSALLLVLALVSALSLSAAAAGFAHADAIRTAPLWFVLVVAGVLGALGSAASGRRGDSPAG